MRRIILLVCALSLCACATTSATIPTAPSAAAQLTKVDEQAVTGAELAYKTWRIAVEAGVNAGFIKGATAAKVAQLDNQLYSALQAIEQAYAAANSNSLAAALVNFNGALAAGYSAIGGK